MRIKWLAVCLLALAGCGGGDGGSTPPPAAPAPPPVVPPPPPAIGATGGTVTESSGATVVFPAGAITGNTTFRIAMDSTGAPAVPADLGAVGNVYVITPHGGDFAQPVEVSIPAPAVTLQPNQLLKLAKASPGGEWTILDDSAVVDGKLTAQVGDFSFFVGVVVTYLVPMAQLEPLRLTTSLRCGNSTACYNSVGNVDAVFTVVGNGGAMPANCATGTLFISRGYGSGSNWLNGGRLTIPRTGGTSSATVEQRPETGHTYGVGMQCGNYRTAFGYSLERRIYWPDQPDFPAIALVRMPEQLDVVEGSSASLEAMFIGGAFRIVNSNEVVPTRLDRAIVDWQRSDDGGASWRSIATSFQDEANPLPAGSGLAWRPWSVRHGFIAASSDQGALIRAHACYTPPAPTAASPCAFGTSTRINVLQQSDLPRISAAPRSVLIRTAETANFSVTASGQPAPTLQWQTRAANATGEWSDLAVGTGITTANYTTPPRVLSDNGQQYRVVATNAIGSTASAPVTVSVSDLDVAPSITTQPGSLSVVAGGDAVFAIDAYGTEALSYQWRANGVDIVGANSPVLRIGAVTNANAGAYTVSVTNNAGNVVSAAATLTVTAGTPAVVAPSIVAQPVALAVNAGQSASFAVGVSGTGPLSFQWRRDGVNIVGATSAVLSFANVALPNAGLYSVVVSNAAGAAVSSNALLEVTLMNVSAEPTITSQPATLIVPAGGSGLLAVGATGAGPISYQWSFNGVAIPGATSPVLSFTNVGNAQVGSYQVAVTNPFGTANSNNASFILLGAPVVTQQPAAATANEGATATFTVAASGSHLRYTWMVNGSPIGGANAASYTTPTLVGANSGAVYSVIVHNGAGLVFSQGATLTVQTIVAPTIISHPASSTIAPGAQAQMCLTIGGTPTFDVQLQRWNGSTWVGGAGVLVNGNTNVCYFTDPLDLANTGAQFRFSVANPAGQVVTNTATVTVQAPSITGTTLVSQAIAGGPPNNISDRPSMSADGNLVAFTSIGTNLHPDAPNNHGHAYVRNLATGVTRLINYNASGGESSLGVAELKLSSNGRYALFVSTAGDLVAGDTNNSPDVFRRDLETGTTQRLSVLPNGDELPFGLGGNAIFNLDISADGRVVIFKSAYDLTTGAPNNGYYLYHLDAQSGFRGLVAGSQTYQVYYSALSDNGEYVAYEYGIFGNGDQTVELFDIEAGGATAEIFRYPQSGGNGIGPGISISSDGRYIAFSLLSTLYTGSPHWQVAVRDRNDPNALVIVSTNAGVPGDAGSGWPTISGDGRYVMFSTVAPSLTDNLALPFRSFDIVADLVDGDRTIVSRRADGVPVHAGTFVNSDHALSEDGTTLAFQPDGDTMGYGMVGYQIFAAPRP